MTSHSTGIIVCGHYLECLAYLAGNVAGQPVQAFIQSLPSCSTGALNVPISKIKSSISPQLYYAKQKCRNITLMIVYITSDAGEVNAVQAYQ